MRNYTSPLTRHPPVGQSERGLTTKIFVGLAGLGVVLLVALLSVATTEPQREESVHKWLEREGYDFAKHQGQHAQMRESRRAEEAREDLRRAGEEAYAQKAVNLPEPESAKFQQWEEEEGESSGLDLSGQEAGQEDLALNAGDTGPQRWNIEGGVHFEAAGLQGDIVGAEDFEVEEEGGAYTHGGGGKKGEEEKKNPEAEVKDTDQNDPQPITKILPGFYRKKADNIVFELIELKEAKTGERGGKMMQWVYEGSQRNVELLNKETTFITSWPVWGTAGFAMAKDGTGDVIENDKHLFVRSPDGKTWPARAKRPKDDPPVISSKAGGTKVAKGTVRSVNPAELRERCGINKPKKPGPNAWNMEKLHEGVADRTTDPPEPPEELPTGQEVDEKITENPDMDPEAKRKLQALAVTESMRSAWRAYARHAWGADELKPFAKAAHQWVGARRGTGITVVDSLGTLWLMGLKSDFEKAMEWVSNGLDYNAANGVSHFEATIRYVGGLLSAFEMTKEKYPELIKSAEDLVNRLLAAYRGQSGIPKSQVNLRTKATSNWQWAKGGAVLAEFMTIQLEFRTLTLHSKEPLYDMRAQWVTDIIMDKCPEDKLCNTFYDLGQDRFFIGSMTRVCLGAHGDSYFEYLLKQHILTGQTQPEYREWWEESAINLLRKVALEIPNVALVMTEGRRGTDGNTFTKSHNMEHLACFAGGMYALGAAMYPDSKYRKEFISAAENLTDTCRMMYAAWPSKVGPEVAVIRSDSVASNVPHYLLRPEYVETLFLMWRLTRDQRYRDWGWEAFMGMFNNCRAPSGGFSGVKDVRTIPCRHDDVQQSFFLAETLKYLFLLFADDSLVPLDRWVFNTEAHPLKIRTRDPFDMWPKDMKDMREKQMREPVDKRTKLHRKGEAYVNVYEQTKGKLS